MDSVTYLSNQNAISQGESREDGNLLWSRRAKTHLILIFRFFVKEGPYDTSDLSSKQVS